MGKAIWDAVIFLLASSGPAEPFDATGRTHRFRGTPIENTAIENKSVKLLCQLVMHFYVVFWYIIVCSFLFACIFVAVANVDWSS